jgi:hypothetical protein
MKKNMTKCVINENFHFSSWLFKAMSVKPMFLKCILVCIKCKYHPKVNVKKCQSTQGNFNQIWFKTKNEIQISKFGNFYLLFHFW